MLERLAVCLRVALPPQLDGIGHGGACRTWCMWREASRWRLSPNTKCRRGTRIRAAESANPLNLGESALLLKRESKNSLNSQAAKKMIKNRSIPLLFCTATIIIAVQHRRAGPGLFPHPAAQEDRDAPQAER